MKSILVPIDFSKLSLHACSIAAEIAKKNNATLYLMHSIDIPDAKSNSGNLFNTQGGSYQIAIYVRALKKQFTKFITNPIFENLRVMQLIENASDFSKLNEAIEKYEIDFVIVGTSGAAGSKELISGSNAEAISKMCQVPVLSVRKSTKLSDLENIVFASDFKSEIDVPFIKLRSLAGKLGSKLELLYINTPVNFTPNVKIEQTLQYFFQRNDLKPIHYTIYNDFSEEEGIENYLKVSLNSTIALGTHARKGLSQLVRGNLAANLINHCSHPVISIKI
jgi:nucleotide-binding universal stress UspA family protein